MSPHHFDTNTIQLLITVMLGVCNLIVLIWAVTASRNNNRIVMYHSLYNQYENSINGLFKSMKGKVFTESEEKELSKQLQYTQFSTFTFENAHYSIYGLIERLIINDSYSELNKICSNTPVTITEDAFNRVKDIFLVMDIIETGISRAKNHILKIESIHNNIYNSPIVNSLKKVLFGNLTEITNNYLSFGLPIFKRKEFFYLFYAINYSVISAPHFNVTNIRGEYILKKGLTFFSIDYFTCAVRIQEWRKKILKKTHFDKV